MATLPKIGIILTGGTIDSIGHNRLDLAWYIEANKKIGSTELLASLPELQDIADIREIPFRRLPSHALLDKDWIELAALIEDWLESDDLDGMVITHGTNTLEETAYFLNLVLKTTKPVVLVGAMRPSSALSADGYLNIVNAVRTAATPESHGMGCLVVMNDTIFSARDVTKNSTYRVEAFQSRDIGPLGVTDSDGKVIYYHRPAKLHTTATRFTVANMASLPRVDVVVSYVGADGIMIEASARAGAQGIISSGTGAGRPTPTEDAMFDKVRDETGLIMCLCSRIGSGRAVRSPGLRRRGFVAGDNLQPWKARILLSLALTTTRDPDEIQHIFDHH